METVTEIFVSGSPESEIMVDEEHEGQMQFNVLECFDNMIRYQAPIEDIKKIYNEHEFIREHCLEKAQVLLQSDKVSYMTGLLIHSMVVH